MRWLRVLVATGGLDGHDRGLRVLALALRDAGFEVVYMGMRVPPEAVVRSAVQEDVDVIGLSFLSGAHMEYVERLVQMLGSEGLVGRFRLVVGGLIPRGDIERLLALGVDRVFPVGSSIAEVVGYLSSIRPGDPV
jgi:methylmalonyl-CoA mutase C-terminal domain/subunit